MRRGEERIESASGVVEGRIFRFLNHSLRRLSLRRNPEGSPLDKTGPIPAEFLRDPLLAEVPPLEVPSLATTQQDQMREKMMWGVALLISWSVTAVAILRAFRIV
jgi:hypothetical protein